MRRYCSLFLIVLLGLVPVGCANRQGPQTEAPEVIAGANSTPEGTEGQLYPDAVIRLERTLCYGTCPVYELTIKGDGTVAFLGKRFVESEGAHSSQIEPSEVARIIEFAQSIEFFSMAKRYDGQMRVTDLPTTITSIRFGDRYHKVENYFRGPEALRELEMLIDQVAGSAAWVGAR